MINLSSLHTGIDHTERFLNDTIFSEESIQNVTEFVNREVLSTEALERMATTALKAATYATVAFMMSHVVWLGVLPFMAAKMAFGSYIVHSLVGRVCDLASTRYDSELKRVGLRVVQLMTTLLFATLFVPTPYWIRQPFLYKAVVAFETLLWTNIASHALTHGVVTFESSNRT